jgi:hypothetical protein
MNLENTIKNDTMSVEQEQVSDKDKLNEIWSNQEKQDFKSRYGCEILHQRCKIQDSTNQQLPTDSYIVTYLNDESVCYDIIRSAKKSSIFDMYYDKFGNCLESIEWTDGKVNPRLWGYKPPQTKKRK